MSHGTLETTDITIAFYHTRDAHKTPTHTATRLAMPLGPVALRDLNHSECFACNTSVRVHSLQEAHLHCGVLYRLHPVEHRAARRSELHLEHRYPLRRRHPRVALAEGRLLHYEEALVDRT